MVSCHNEQSVHSWKWGWWHPDYLWGTLGRHPMQDTYPQPKTHCLQQNLPKRPFLSPSSRPTMRIPKHIPMRPTPPHITHFLISTSPTPSRLGTRVPLNSALSSSSLISFPQRCFRCRFTRLYAQLQRLYSGPPSEGLSIREGGWVWCVFPLVSLPLLEIVCQMKQLGLM